MQEERHALVVGSGIEIEPGAGIEDHTFIHAKVRDGKIVYIYEQDTREEALEAAGLRG